MKELAFKAANVDVANLILPLASNIPLSDQILKMVGVRSGIIGSFLVAINMGTNPFGFSLLMLASAMLVIGFSRAGDSDFCKLQLVFFASSLLGFLRSIQII